MNTQSLHPQTQPSAADLLHRTALPTQYQKIVKQSQRLVSQAFFGTMLRQMRQSPFKSEKFSGGRGGQAFSEMFDQHLADRMARGSGRKVVNSLVKHIIHGQEEKIEGAPPKVHRKPLGPYSSTVPKVSAHVPPDLRA